MSQLPDNDAPTGDVPRPAYVRVARELREGARAALEHRFEGASRGARARRFAHGFALPFGVFRALLRDKKARIAYFEVLAIELAFLLPLGIAFTLSSDAFDELLSGKSGWRNDLAESWAVVTTLYAGLCVLEWCVIALAREHHEALGYAAAILTGAPSERPTSPPRVRIDTAWLWTKAKRKLREGLLIAVGVPLFALVLLLPVVGEALYATLVSLWAVYWFAVFAIANTFIAWQPRPDDPRHEPWFLRGFALVGRVPVLGIPARVYVKLAARVTRSVHPACVAFEEAPYEAAGLALARAVCSAPVVWLALRPVFGVAAAHALVGRRKADAEIALLRAAQVQ